MASRLGRGNCQFPRLERSRWPTAYHFGARQPNKQGKYPALHLWLAAQKGGKEVGEDLIQSNVQVENTPKTPWIK